MKGNNKAMRDLFREYLEAKLANPNDKGALGDAIEVSLRVLLIGNWNLVHEASIHVAKQDTDDVTSKRLGRVEIGHNGKSWTDLPEHKRVVYGMFNREILIGLLAKAAGDPDRYLDSIARRMLVWDNWSEYAEDVNRDMGKGGIRWVNENKRGAGYYQTRCNESKVKIWYRVKDKWNRPTLYDLLQD